MSASPPPGSPVRPSLRVPLVLLASALASTGVATAFLAHSFAERERARYENAVETARDRVRARLEVYEAVLRAGSALFEVDEDLSRAEFQRFAASLGLHDHYPGILGIGFSRRLTAAERPAAEAALARAMPGFRIWPRAPRDEYHTIAYLEPLDRRNLAALGYDMATEPVRREAMERARDGGAPAASGRVVLVQEIEEPKQAGFLIYAPVYRGPGQPATLEQRRARLLGFVYAPFRADDLFRGIFGSERHPRVTFRVYDGPRAEPGALLHTAGPAAGADEEAPPRFTSTSPLEVAGRVWTLTFASTPDLAASSSEPLLPLIGLAGALVSLVLFGLGLAQASSRARAEAAAAELAASEEALRQTARQLRLITDAAPALISYVDRDLRYRFTNAAYADWFGPGRSGATVREVVGEEAWATLSRPLERALQGEALALEATFLHRALGPRRVRVSYVPDRGPDGVRGLVVLGVDVTEQRRAEERAAALARDLTRQVGEFRTLIDVLPIGIAVARDPGCRRIALNPALAELLGRPGQQEIVRDEAPPFELRVFAGARELPADERPLRRAALGGEVVGEEIDIEPGAAGVRRTLLVHATPLRDEDGAPRGAVAAFLDISERKRAELAKDRFLAMLGHELRNPLAPMAGALDLLRLRRHDAAATARAQEVLERQLRHLSRLVDDLLDVSRITSGRIRLERERLDLAQVVRAAVLDAEPAARGAGLTLELRGDPGPLPVLGDPIRLGQALGNVLANAIKFTDPGGRITVDLRAEDQQMVVRVRDTGIGMPAELLAQGFEPFVQADVSLDRSRGGLGLGLAVVRGLIELHGGVVTAASPGPGAGTEVTLRLPASPGPLPPPREDAPPPRAAARPKPLLIVEDNRDAALALAEVLEALGHEVAVAHAGPEGVEMARRTHPEVVLCDLGLPGMDGFEVARRLRQDPATRDALLVAVSGYGQEEDRARARAAGFDRHLLKPVSLTELEGLLA